MLPSLANDAENFIGAPAHEIQKILENRYDFIITEDSMQDFINEFGSNIIEIIS